MSNAIGNQSSRVIYFDVLNILACFGVVAMHVNGLTHSYSRSLRWVQALSVDCLFYWAVPVFFMLTGATLLGYRSRYSTKEFLRKRIERTVVPFIAWSLISYLWQLLMWHSETLTPPELLNAILLTEINNRFWFFIPLFAAYLCIPVFSLFVNNGRLLTYCIAIGSAVNIVLPFVVGVIGLRWNTAFSFGITSGYLIYVLIGYWLANNDVPKWIANMLCALGILLTCYRFFGTWTSSFATNELVKVGVGYTNVPCFFESIAVFLFVKRLLAKRHFSDRVVCALSRVSACSFGIYLVHSIVIWHIQDLTGLTNYSNLWRLAGPLVVYALCLGLVALARKVPGLRKLFP